MSLQAGMVEREPRRHEPIFWIGLSLAALLHGALIVGLVRTSSLRHMGKTDGRPDSLTVELVDLADLRSKSTIPAERSAPAGDGRRPEQASQAGAEPSPPPGQPAAPQPQEPSEAAVDTEALKAAPPRASPAPAKPDVAAAPAPKTVPAPQRKQTQPLDLAMPPDTLAAAGQDAGMVRPSDITRSGENYEFGRRVVRALRQTMPPPRASMLGRVTVRMLLSDNGNLSELRLIRSSGNHALDQSVMFAVKQTNFPLPPGGSTVSDRTFVVTYIYN